MSASPRSLANLHNHGNGSSTANLSGQNLMNGNQPAQHNSRTSPVGSIGADHSDPFPAKRVTIGFNAPTSGLASGDTPVNILQTAKIPTSAKDLSPDLQGYRSQIPGWTDERTRTVSQSSGGAIAIPVANRSPSSHASSGILSASFDNRRYRRDRKSSIVDIAEAAKSPPRLPTGSQSTEIVSRTIAASSSADLMSVASKPEKMAQTSATPVHTSSRPTSGHSTGQAKQAPPGKNLEGLSNKALRKAARAAKVDGRVPQQAGGSSSGPTALVYAKNPASHNLPKDSAKSANGRPSHLAGSGNGVGGVGAVRNAKEVALFSHLSSFGRSIKGPEVLRKEMRSKGQALHPSVIRLGVQYQHYAILGSNLRCVAMMQAFREVIQDYRTPPNNTLCRHLDSHLKPQINYLVSCRPMAVSMGNAIRFLKLEIASISPDMPEDDAKTLLDEKICTFVRDRIACAATVIVDLALQKIRPNDVILTFGCSSVVKKLLITAHRNACIAFRVIVVDSRPLLEGRALVKALIAEGVQCTYVHLNALSYVIKDVSKVIIGAHALLANGFVMSRVGTAIVALMAHEMNVPVIVCCETYKFSDRVQLDSFVNNELGDADELVDNFPEYSDLEDTILRFDAGRSQTESVIPVPKALAAMEKMSDSLASISEASTLRMKNHLLMSWRNVPDLKLLNLMYDVTPSEFVTVVITELGMLPCSSVPVVIRETLHAASGNL